MSADLRSIPLSEVAPNTTSQLRTPQKKKAGYIQLLDSIRSNGILEPIQVRPAIDPESQREYFEIINGLHRYTCAVDLGLEDIPCNVIIADDERVMFLQAITNLQRVETRHAEYAEHLKRILASRPDLTESSLAAELNYSPTWVQARLGLNKIKSDDIKRLINEGVIKLTNALALAKLPEDEQAEWVERASSEDSVKFVKEATQRAKEIKDAKRKGGSAPKEFHATPHVRKFSVLKEQLESGEAAKELAGSLDSPIEAFQLAIAYCLTIDPASVEAQRAAWDAKQKEAADKKAAKAAGASEGQVAKANQKAEEAKMEAANVGARAEGSDLPYPDWETLKETRKADAKTKREAKALEKKQAEAATVAANA